MSTMYPSEREEQQWAMDDVVKQGMERVRELEAEIASLQQQVDRLTLERDSAKDQFDKHVEWASVEIAKVEAENASLRQQIADLKEQR